MFYQAVFEIVLKLAWLAKKTYKVLLQISGALL